MPRKPANEERMTHQAIVRAHELLEQVACLAFHLKDAARRRQEAPMPAIGAWDDSSGCATWSPLRAATPQTPRGSCNPCHAPDPAISQSD
ncbi:hypothetical protein M885DRAFT_507297 [Pelagophyceae sp. CCMP2097]|nr:hypothetical protein M885DRAFT_507297 [Pelagophyceae sp. CCMP2097]